MTWFRGECSEEREGTESSGEVSNPILILSVESGGRARGRSGSVLGLLRSLTPSPLVLSAVPSTRLSCSPCVMKVLSL